MYQKPYTCIEINVLLHFSDLRALILHYIIVRGSIFPEIQKHFNFRERSRSWHTTLLSLSICRWLLETFIRKIFGFAVLKSLYCIILYQCHHPPLHILFSCISRFLLVNLSKFGPGMFIKCCILPSRNIKSAKASGAPLRTPLGELTALPQTP